MEIGAVTQARALEALATAFAAADADAPAQTNESGPAAQSALAVPALRPTETSFDAMHDSTATPADASDVGPQAATTQTFGRPHAPVVEPLHEADASLPNADHAGSEFAIPADRLVQVLLTGLQVEALAAWPLLRHAADELRPQRRRDDEPSARVAHDDPVDDDEHAAGDADGQDDADAAATVPLDEAVEPDWCEALTQGLRMALTGKVAPRALLVAAEQWQRGRCVVLACPQGPDPAGPAWAFVLWPRRGGADARRLALRGLRVEARLLWTTTPDGAPLWCHVRVVKEHHPRHGRQLVPIDVRPGAPVACAVQLGPVLGRPLRGCEVCLRIDAVRRFWTALGAQWSACVVVSALPLVAPRAVDIVEAS